MSLDTGGAVTETGPGAGGTTESGATIQGVGMAGAGTGTGAHAGAGAAAVAEEPGLTGTGEVGGATAGWGEEMVEYEGAGKPTVSGPKGHLE